MRKKTAKIAFFSLCSVFIVGLALIFAAPAIGISAGSTAIQKAGGSMDTNQFEMIMNTTITSYQIGGLTIALVGGFGLLLCGYALYKEI